MQRRFLALAWRKKLQISQFVTLMDKDGPLLLTGIWEKRTPEICEITLQYQSIYVCKQPGLGIEF